MVGEHPPCAPDWRVMHPHGPPAPGSKVEVVKYPVEADGQTVKGDERDGHWAGASGVVTSAYLVNNGSWRVAVNFKTVVGEKHGTVAPWNCFPVEVQI